MTAELGPDEMVTASQAAELVKHHRRTIIAWIQNGWLPAVKRPGLRGRYMIKYSDLLQVANRPYRPQEKENG